MFEKEIESINKIHRNATVDEYYKLSEDRKIITPENIGDLVDYPALFVAMQDDRELRPALTESMSTGKTMCDYLTMGSVDFFDKYIAADGPINEKTGKPYLQDSKKYQEWAALQSKTPVSTAQIDMFNKMYKAYREHAFIKPLIGDNNTIPKTYVANNIIVEGNINGIMCMCKIDKLYITEGKVIVVDIKTTSDLTSFEDNIDDLYYDYQQALIVRLLHTNGINTVESVIAAIEKSKLPRCGVFKLGSNRLAYSTSKLDNILTTYRRSMDIGLFGTRFEDVVELH